MVVPKFKIREAYGYILLKLEERGAYSLNFTQILGQMIFLKKKKEKEEKKSHNLSIFHFHHLKAYLQKSSSNFILKKSPLHGVTNLPK